MIPLSAWATARAMAVVRARTSVNARKAGSGRTAVDLHANSSNSVQVSSNFYVLNNRQMTTCLVLLGHGVCSSFDNCDCEAFWKGDACDLPHCPSAENENVDCSGNGQCIGPQFCLCNDTHFGEHCQRPGEGHGE